MKDGYCLIAMLIGALIALFMPAYGEMEPCVWPKKCDNNAVAYCLMEVIMKNGLNDKWRQTRAKNCWTLNSVRFNILPVDEFKWAGER